MVTRGSVDSDTGWRRAGVLELGTVVRHAWRAAGLLRVREGMLI
jgi:hypothetical protein